MRKSLSSTVIGIMIALMLIVGLSGCAKSQAVNSKAALTNDQALNVIVSDLRQHGISVKSININKVILNSSGSLASVEFVVTLPDGRTLTEKVNLVKEKNQWSIEGHKH